MANPNDIRNPRAEPARKMTWKPPSLLPDPKPNPDWEYRWVRTHIFGDADHANVSVRAREGWVPVKPEEVPEVAKELVGAAPKATVEIGGQMLCKMPKEMAEARTEYYANLTRRQEESVDNNLMRESNPRMPLDRPSKRTKVTFGRPRSEDDL